MIAHGALNVNYGHKKTVVPDRHQQRKREALEEVCYNNKSNLKKMGILSKINPRCWNQKKHKTLETKREKTRPTDDGTE